MLKKIKKFIITLILFTLERTYFYKFFRKNPAVIKVWKGAQNSKNNRKLCIFASYTPDENIPDYVVFYLKALKKEGFDIVFVTTAPSVGEASLLKLMPLCRYIVLRRNYGYDFGSWKAGLLLEEIQLEKYEKLLLTNDSCYAPIYPLRETLEKFNGDMNGITDSFEIRYHLMSYFILYDKTIFHRADFLRIWKNIRMLPVRLKGLIIRLYEIGISQYYLNRGFRLVTGFSVKSLQGRFDRQTPIGRINSVHKFWAELIAFDRCPILKVDLFKRFFNQQSTDHWKKILDETEYPIRLIFSHQYPEGKKHQVPKIYQIYFRRQQKKLLSPDFIPYFKPENEEKEWREYWTFSRNSRKAMRSRAPTGYLSWKFFQKSRVPSNKFLRFINENPGFDVYYLNPFPLDGLLFDSVWIHGDIYHPGLTNFSSSLLHKAGYAVNIEKQKNSAEQTAYANYWVGTGKFWKHYIDFTRPLEQYIRKNLTNEEKKYIYSIADPISNCSHIPFIFERMFTTLLVEKPEIRAIAYAYDSEDLRARYSSAGRVLYYLLKSQWMRKSPIGWVLRKLVIAGRNLRNRKKSDSRLPKLP